MASLNEEISDYLRKITNNAIHERHVIHLIDAILFQTSVTINYLKLLLYDFIHNAKPFITQQEFIDICTYVFKLYEKFEFENIDSEDNSKLPNNISTQMFLDASIDDFDNPYIDMKKLTINTNPDMKMGAGISMQSKFQRQKERQLKLMRDWEKSKAVLPPPTRRCGATQLEKLGDIVLNNVTLCVAGKELLKQASLKIVCGRKYGLVGRNGIGKSTLIGALVRHEIPGLSKDITIGCVEQGNVYWNIMCYLEMDSSVLKLSALDAVLSVFHEYNLLLKKEKALLEQEQTDAVGEALNQVYSRLEEIDATRAETEAASILAGLLIPEEKQSNLVSTFSGGFRIRIALARSLFASPDILCLDEPTNHLDIPAVSWLTNYLSRSRRTCIIVSHSRDFLNSVCTDIIEFKNQTLKYYKGDYNTYERVKTESERLLQRRVEADKMKREHIQKFIDKFRYKKSGAAMAQSRIKALKKMPILEAVCEDPTLKFTFETPEELGAPILQLKNVSYSYDKVNYIFRNTSIDVTMDSRIAICGANGSGKSTLLKLLVGDVQPTSGEIFRSGKLRIGFFNQHHVDSLDLTLNSVQQLQERYSSMNIKDEAARAFLGKFGITGLIALEPLYVLSGGQKSRILDEPTNHLDLEAVEALIVAIMEYEGGVIVVSHDTHFLSCIQSEIWYLDPARSDKLLQYKNSMDKFQEEFYKP